MTPSIRTAAAAVCLVSLGALSAFAEEGRLPVRAGDTVTGTLRRCGERHSLEVELVRGERFRVRLEPKGTAPGQVHLRIFDPEGVEQTLQARTRMVGNDLLVGPYKVVTSGIHTVEIVTFSVHGTEYEATTSVRRRRRKTVNLTPRRGERVLRAAAGATFTARMKKGEPHIALALPGEDPEDFTAGDARLTALLGDGLSAPRAGDYTFRNAAERGRVRITVRAPELRERETLVFPVLPLDTPPATTWRWTNANVWTPAAQTPQESDRHPKDPGGLTGVEPTVLPPPSSFPSPALCGFGPARVTPGTAGAGSMWTGPLSGVGLPLSGIPTLAEVVSDGRIEETATGPRYVYTRQVADMGGVTFRVRFEVDGRPARAPIGWDGRTVMHWETTNADTAGGEGFVQGRWLLANDELRGLQVLDGRETWIDRFHRTRDSAAGGFTVPSDGTWPSGTLVWGDRGGLTGASFTRRESHGADQFVLVEISERGGPFEGTTLDMTATGLLQ